MLIIPLKMYQTLGQLVASLCVFIFIALMMVPDAFGLVQQQKITDVEASNLIVKVTANNTRSAQVKGLGIILGASEDSMYIATANHVVRLGTTEFTNVLIETNSSVSPISASIHKKYDNDDDLAVLVVDLDAIKSQLADSLNFEVLGKPEKLRSGEELFSMHNPLVNTWTKNYGNPFIFSNLDDDILEFGSGQIRPGHSGGGLFDKNNCLVGLIQRTIAGKHSALPIDVAIDYLEQWNIPLSLTEKRMRRPIRWVLFGGGAIAGAVAGVLLLSGDDNGDPSMENPVGGDGTDMIVDPPGRP